MTWLDERMKDENFAKAFAEETLVEDVTNEILRWMETQGVSRAELAARLGTSRAYVTQMLGGKNMTIRTLARVVHVMGGRSCFHITGPKTRLLIEPKWLRWQAPNPYQTKVQEAA